jgi:hypothetical protein
MPIHFAFSSSPAMMFSCALLKHGVPHIGGCHANLSYEMICGVVPFLLLFSIRRAVFFFLLQFARTDGTQATDCDSAKKANAGKGDHRAA